MDTLNRELTFQLPTNLLKFDTITSRIFADNSFVKVGQSESSTVGFLSDTDNILKQLNAIGNNGTNHSSTHTMDMLRNQIVLTSDFINRKELTEQIEYDKFMNEIWIGIVLTLIVISMVFCICSCFLYHQFRLWKRNYTTDVSQNNDIESAKLNPIEDDPVPEYTLVSGLPTYDAALELLQKSPSSCLIVYPTVFNVFSINEKHSKDRLRRTGDEVNVHSRTHEPECIPSYDEAIATIVKPKEKSTNDEKK